MMASAFPQGWAASRPGAATDDAGIERVLRQAGMVEVASREFVAPLTWTLDGVVSHFESTSVCSRRALGGGFAAFEAELREALAPLLVDGRLREDARFGFTLGRR